jgi:hypothetical protein
MVSFLGSLHMADHDPPPCTCHDSANGAAGKVPCAGCAKRTADIQPKRRKRLRRPQPPLPDDGPTGPTEHPPRTEGKLRVFAARAKRRLPLFDPRDAPGDE